MCGCLKSPPEAMPPIKRASCRGVVVIAPWPMPTEMVSPAYHLRWNTRSTHCSEGIKPVSSEGRSIPVLWLTPFFFRNANGKIVGIGRGAADQGQNFTGAGIEGDHGTWPRAQRLLGDLLQVVVDGESNLFAGNGLLLGEAHILHFLADAVDDDAAHAVGAH